MIPFDAKAMWQQNAVVAGKHRERMADPEFKAACVAALQHYNDIQTRDGKTGAFDRMAGAREFVGVLLNLSEVPVAPVKAPKNEINYKA